MFLEREQLVKHTFPELSLLCHQNSLFFTEVHYLYFPISLSCFILFLGWPPMGYNCRTSKTRGSTKYMSWRLAFLFFLFIPSINTLKEVDKCRPFFCCILGERYGWYSNPQKPDPLLQLTFQKASQNYPWVLKYLCNGKGERIDKDFDTRTVIWIAV